jgi:hypothetical protein
MRELVARENPHAPLTLISSLIFSRVPVSGLFPILAWRKFLGAQIELNL